MYFKGLIPWKISFHQMCYCKRQRRKSKVCATKYLQSRTVCMFRQRIRKYHIYLDFLGHVQHQLRIKKGENVKKKHTHTSQESFELYLLFAIFYFKAANQPTQNTNSSSIKKTVIHKPKRLYVGILTTINICFNILHIQINTKHTKRRLL